MDAGPEVDAHHHPRTGRAWLDISLSVSAMFVSVISVALAFRHGDAMERMVQQNARMVQASTWPFLTLGTSNADQAGRPLYKLVLVNSGIGPAKIEQLRFSYRGKPMGDVFALADAVAREAGLGHSRVARSDTGGVVPAREHVDLMTAQLPTTSPSLIAALNGAGADQVDVQACYCSIFDECWATRLKNAPAQPVVVGSCQGDRWTITLARSSPSTI